MLSKDVNFYYRQILEKYPNSYFTQDLNKVIIGIDYEYLDANSITFSELKAKFYEYAAGEKLCEYAGFFGVLSADFIHLFENLPSLERKNYDFPPFLLKFLNFSFLYLNFSYFFVLLPKFPRLR